MVGVHLTLVHWKKKKNSTYTQCMYGNIAGGKVRCRCTGRVFFCFVTRTPAANSWHWLCCFTEISSGKPLLNNYTQRPHCEGCPDFDVSLLFPLLGGKPGRIKTEKWSATKGFQAKETRSRCFNEALLERTKQRQYKKWQRRENGHINVLNL